MEQRHTRGGKCTVWACCRGNGLGNCLATGNGTTTCLPRCPQKVSVCMCVSLMWRKACRCWIHTITHNQSVFFVFFLAFLFEMAPVRRSVFKYDKHRRIWKSIWRHTSCDRHKDWFFSPPVGGIGVFHECDFKRSIMRFFAALRDPRGVICLSCASEEDGVIF